MIIQVIQRAMKPQNRKSFWRSAPASFASLVLAGFGSARGAFLSRDVQKHLVRQADAPALPLPLPSIMREHMELNLLTR